MEELRKTVCNRDCPDVCGIVATVRDGRVVRLQGDKEHPVTRGFLCHRTSHFLELQYAPDRLTTPLHRRDGKLVPIGWDEALDIAASTLTRIRDESGPASILHYRSGGSLGLLLAVTDYFFEKFGPTASKRGDICSGAGDAAQLMDFGEEDSNDLFDLLNARNILLWGKNVFTSSPHSIPILKDARARGASLVLIDPVHHQTASLCERFIQPRPGGDLALALAVGRLLFEHGWVHPDAATWCDHLDGFRALCTSRATAEWCAMAEVNEDVALDLARRLKDGPTTILVGWGMGRRINGAAIVRALDALGAITGNIGIPGGGVSFYFKRRGAFDTSFVEGRATRTVCEATFGEEILAASDPPIRAVWITAGNPVAMLPDSRKVAAALRTREFVVVVDSWLSDTAEHAHLVLPTNTLLEAHDVVGSYGHHYLGVAEPVVPPPEGVKTDLEIMQGLASRVGLAQELAGDSASWLRRIVGTKLAPHGMTLETLRNGYVRNPLSPRVIFQGRKFKTASGKVNLMRELPPDVDAGAHNPAYPLFLMAMSTEKSQASQWVRPPAGPLPVTIHPDALPGCAEGQLVRVESAVGSMDAVLKLDPRQRTDVALMPKGGDLRGGRAANALIRGRTTDLGEGAALYDERVRLVPLNT